MTKPKQEVDINIRIDLANLSATPTKVKTETPAVKLKTTLSVAQLVYLFKLFTETGIIKSKNISDLLRFLSDNFSTPRAEDISFDSLRMKYYNPDPTTIQNVKDVILKQLNFIQKKRGNT